MAVGAALVRTRRPAAILALAAIAIAALLVWRNAGPVDPLARLTRDANGTRTGSIWFPRGGPYVLGFDTPPGETGVGELFIDGKRVATGPGRAKNTRPEIHAPGAHAILFRAPPGARLVWHPPGRRGADELVPPSSLAPESPTHATFGPGVGAHRRDAAFACALLAVALAAVAALARFRPRFTAESLAPFSLPAAVFAVALVLRLASVGAAGETWDEGEYFCAGKHYLLNLLSLDVREWTWRANLEHPPVTKYVAGLGALFADSYAPARSLFALLGACACALGCAIGTRLFGARAGLVGGLACALSPHLVAHSVVIGHETPSVFFAALGLLVALRAGDDGRSLLRSLALTGVVLGLAVATRFTNLLLAPVLGLTLLVVASPALRLRTALLGLAVVPLTAATVVYAVWPRLWSAPVAHLGEAWRKLKLPHTVEPYLGELTREPAWHYFPVYLVATAPFWLLACALAGGARSAVRRERGGLILLALILCPLGVAWSPVRQDGVRYILPAVFALALLAGAGVDALAARLRASFARALPIAFLAYLVIVAARIHPYYLDYYGEQVGGPATVGPTRRFELGWWGEGIAEAVDYVNQHAPHGARVFRAVQPNHVTWLRGDLWPVLEAPRARPADADYILYNRAADPFGTFVIPPAARLVHEVTAQGAVLARVYRVDRASPRLTR